MKYDAIMRDFSIEQNPSGTVQVIGKIYQDAKGRFEDGESVITSYVVSVAKEGDNWYARTRNSVYKLEGFV